MTESKVRADRAATDMGLAKTRSQAQDQISRGVITLDGKKIKPSHMLSREQTQLLKRSVQAPILVSRAGEKLLFALEVFKISPRNLRVLDIGQSTGGFTQVLLDQAARFVLGVDVGHGQINPELAEFAKKNPHRLVCLEGVNARELSRHQAAQAHTQDGFDLIVMDVSFISSRLILEDVAHALKSSGEVLILFKPQFEVGAKNLDKRGVVKSDEAIRTSQDELRKAASNLGLRMSEFHLVPLRGKTGNREYIVHAQKN